jgi:fatty acid desaturase
MTAMTTPYANPQTLPRHQVDAIEAELDAIRQRVMGSLGTADVDHIRRMVLLCRASEISGRALLHFGVGPLSWLAGVAALASAKILDNMEIGHNVMHGQYDWTGDPALQSHTFEWDIACDGDSWRHSHNVVHHTHTNILGKDRDIGYSLLRLTPEQRWKPRHLLQPLANLLLALGFQYGVGSHDLEVGRYKHGALPKPVFMDRWRRFKAKVGKQWFKDYLLFPALSLWAWPRVLAGNFVANLIRNLWTYAVIFCGHFTEHVTIYRQEDTQNETRGDWYLRQMAGSSNLTGARWFHIATGHLSHQIEHHLFPDMPAHRYAEIAPEVQALCAKYNLRYNTGSLFTQFTAVMKRIWVHTWPARPALA